MSLYVYRSDIEAEIDNEHLTKFLADSETGEETEGLFTKLADAVDAEILGNIASLPQDVITALQAYLRHCGKVLFCSMAFRRKGVADEQNPFAKLAEGVRERLSEIQKGDVSFRQLKSLSFLVPARSSNPFAVASERIENIGSANPSYSSASGQLVLTATDGTQWRMVVSYSGGQVVHSWEAI